jgi:hypothetical protein
MEGKGKGKGSWQMQVINPPESWGPGHVRGLMNSLRGGLNNHEAAFGPNVHEVVITLSHEGCSWVRVWSGDHNEDGLRLTENLDEWDANRLKETKVYKDTEKALLYLVLFIPTETGAKFIRMLTACKTRRDVENVLKPELVNKVNTGINQSTLPESPSDLFDTVFGMITEGESFAIYDKMRKIEEDVTEWFLDPDREFTEITLSDLIDALDAAGVAFTPGRFRDPTTHVFDVGEITGATLENMRRIADFHDKTKAERDVKFAVIFVLLKGTMSCKLARDLTKDMKNLEKIKTAWTAPPLKTEVSLKPTAMGDVEALDGVPEDGFFRCGIYELDPPLEALKGTNQMAFGSLNRLMLKSCFLRKFSEIPDGWLEEGGEDEELNIPKATVWLGDPVAHKHATLKNMLRLFPAKNQTSAVKFLQDNKANIKKHLLNKIDKDRAEIQVDLSQDEVIDLVFKLKRAVKNKASASDAEDLLSLFK